MLQFDTDLPLRHEDTECPETQTGDDYWRRAGTTRAGGHPHAGTSTLNMVAAAFTFVGPLLPPEERTE